jgi:hypothetical protein
MTTELIEHPDYRALLSRYDGVARAAQEQAAELQVLRAQAGQFEAERQRDAAAREQQQRGFETQMNTLNGKMQDLMIEVQRLRIMLREAGIDPDGG